MLEFGQHVRTREEHFDTAYGKYLVLHGDPNGAIAHYRALVDAGARYIIVAGLADTTTLRLFAEQVMPQVAEA